MSHTPYVDFEDGEYTGHHIKRVGCMKCNTTIASKNPDGSLYYWTNKRDITVVLSNGTHAFIPVCADCEISATHDDLQHFENTVKHGWLKEQTWAFKKYPHRGVNSVINAGKQAKDIFIVKRAN